MMKDQIAKAAIIWTYLTFTSQNLNKLALPFLTTFVLRINPVNGEILSGPGSLFCGSNGKFFFLSVPLTIRRFAIWNANKASGSIAKTANFPVYDNFISDWTVAVST